MDLQKLKEPFPPEDIEWRIQQSGMKDKGPWALIIAYVTNRAIMDRLDDVCGISGWKNEFIPAPSGGVLCGLSIKIGDEWITKWDGAENTQIESVKGGLSGSMKRAAVQWGMGRSLYHLKATFANFTTTGGHRDKIDNKYYKWDPPELPKWYFKDTKPAQAPVKSTPQATTSPQKADTKPPVTKPATSSNMITQPQLKAIRNEFIGKHGLAGDKSTEVCSLFIKKKITSKEELTKKEASDIISASKSGTDTRFNTLIITAQSGGSTTTDGDQEDLLF